MPAAERARSEPGRPPDRREVARRDDRVGRQPVDLGVVGQQEERPGAADAVARVVPVQLRALLARHPHALQPRRGTLAQLVERAELDRLGRACLRARRLLASLEAVVAERALPHPPVPAALVEHAERARDDAVAAAVAHVRLHHDGPELRPEQRAGRAHVQTRRLGAVLADVRAHQPAQVSFLALLHELHVAPAVRAERPGVVVGLSREPERVVGHLVPFLARHLARLAADADGRVGEEPDALARLLAVGLVSSHRCSFSRPTPARRR